MISSIIAITTKLLHSLNEGNLFQPQLKRVYLVVMRVDISTNTNTTTHLGSLGQCLGRCGRPARLAGFFLVRFRYGYTRSTRLCVSIWLLGSIVYTLESYVGLVLRKVVGCAIVNDCRVIDVRPRTQEASPVWPRRKLRNISGRKLLSKTFDVCRSIWRAHMPWGRNPLTVLILVEEPWWAVPVLVGTNSLVRAVKMLRPIVYESTCFIGSRWGNDLRAIASCMGLLCIGFLETLGAVVPQVQVIIVLGHEVSLETLNILPGYFSFIVRKISGEKRRIRRWYRLRFRWKRWNLRFGFIFVSFRFHARIHYLVPVGKRVKLEWLWRFLFNRTMISVLVCDVLVSLLFLEQFIQF